MAAEKNNTDLPGGTLVEVFKFEIGKNIVKRTMSIDEYLLYREKNKNRNIIYRAYMAGDNPTIITNNKLKNVL